MQALGIPSDRAYSLHMSLEREYNALWEETQDDRLFAQYTESWYAVSCVECFLDYTKGSVQNFAKWLTQRNRDSGMRVLDLGAGIGASTRLLAELTGLRTIFHVYNKQSAQRRVAQVLLDGETEEIVTFDEVHAAISTDARAIMAFELFEHLHQPVAVAESLTMNTRVEVICCANSFTQAGDLGHWREYIVNGERIPRKSMGRVFNRVMRDMGWTLEDTGFYNGRPNIWTR